MVYYITRQQEAFPSQYVKTLSSLEEALAYCKNLPIISIDFETTGLDFIEDKPVLLAIGDHKNQFVINLFDFGLEAFREFLESEEKLKIAHNVKFEYLMFKQHYGITLEKVWDTMLQSRIITCGSDTVRHSLEEVAKRYLGIAIDKTEQKKFQGKVTGIFREDQILYAAKDIEILPRLKDVMDRQISILNLQNVMMLENEAVLAFGDIEFNGMPLNREKWLVLADQAERNKYEIEAKLESYLQSYECFRSMRRRGVQLDLFDPNALHKLVNWDSPAQTVKVFQCLHPSIVDTEERTLLNLIYHPSTTDALIEHSGLSADQIKAFVRLYLDFKEASKAAGAYGREFLRHVKSDGKVHTSFQQILKTGRVSSKEPNLQQIPAKKEYRNCFEAPPGYVFVSSDFSSQELAVIAYGSKDPVFLSALENGRDLHSVAAVVVYGEDWLNAAEDGCAFYAKDEKGEPQYKKCDCKKHGKMRTAVKTINFG